MTAALLGAVLGALPAAAGSWTDSSPEGFSESERGLSGEAVTVWNATVLIRGQALLGRWEHNLRLHTTAGSGLVLLVDGDRGSALVVTNFHVISCGDRLCHLHVGLAADGSGEGLWTQEVTVAASDPDRDLAFLEVVLPTGPTITAPRLASSSCLSAVHPRVLTIGWPDLSVRQEWGVQPPANRGEHLKRYSHGIFLLDLAHYRPHTSSGRILKSMEVIFHNADVLPGDSGGPLLTRDGLVVGINSQVVGDASVPGYRYCARRSRLDHSPCAHLAIPAEVIATDLRRLLLEEVAVASCSPASRGAGSTIRTALKLPAAIPMVP